MGNEEVGYSDVGGFENPLNSVMVFGVDKVVVREEREEEPSYEADEGDKQDRVGGNFGEKVKDILSSRSRGDRRGRGQRIQQMKCKNMSYSDIGKQVVNSQSMQQQKPQQSSMGNEEVGCSDVGGFEDPLNSVMVFGVNEAVVREEREDEPSYEEDEGDKQDRIGEEKRDSAMAIKGSSKGHSLQVE
nr:hypothetical protein Iba_chr10cCG11100 [Ipomoea batatas]